MEVASKKSGIAALVGRKMTKKTKFMGEEVLISKLTIAQTQEIQDLSKSIEGDESRGLDVLKLVIKLGADGASELTDADFEQLPIDELSSLANAIMSHSGMNPEAKKA